MGNVLFFPMNDLVSFKDPSAMPEIAEFGTAELDCSIFPNVPIKQQSQCDPQDGRDDNRDNPAEWFVGERQGHVHAKKAGNDGRHCEQNRPYCHEPHDVIQVIIQNGVVAIR